MAIGGLDGHLWISLQPWQWQDMAMYVNVVVISMGTGQIVKEKTKSFQGIWQHMGDTYGLMGPNRAFVENIRGYFTTSLQDAGFFSVMGRPK